MKALIIIDIQNDFLPGGALAVNKGDEVIPIINKLQQTDFFDLVVATQDWHPQNHGSFASNHPGKNQFDKTTLGGLEQILWPDHCVQETNGAEFSDKLDTKKIEAIFRKGMDPNIDSYSGFFDNGKKKDTGLAAYLKGRNVDEIYLAGLAGDFCVYYSALDSADFGFKTYFIEDAARSIDENNFENVVKKNLLEKGVSIIKSTDIIN
ncbi:MAG TPA: bifunctional nicotinamidase/pyrazinamidase [Ignavibacteriaceae bacterium]|jgi:nicotinamidase/pyrazinamidase|nr:MAG: nicotinamidase/pyrazinamidase [Ignavibacteria bacterium ADurb.Bin266]OQY74198.1 MAG: nicotinamidase [Ignavibacteriales bacterium UTCHB2]HQF41867.1 bifunctional nicotinamidase/pyrazinamidase [Ignavibacteriaceae bacterium]HQI39836.1 bifunctional nicotinamidase/pyrazinamidase [Ignavibacteriaceae bacterium]HQJ45499.1 bifunctional nicotinamidase/pyrazinamidase [Ignavibacteriaceae bacterium]